MYYLRYKIDRYQATGLINVDITKGYERVNFANLVKAIDLLDSISTKRLFKVWAFMVFNLDYLINGKVVKSTKGIPMGLALSPVAFVLYMHKALENIDKEYLVSYMDDLSILMLRDGMNDNYVKEVLSALKSFGLDVNPRKSVIFTDGEKFDDKFHPIYSWFFKKCLTTCKDLIKFEEIPDYIWEIIQNSTYKEAVKTIDNELKSARSSIIYWEKRKEEFNKQILNT